MLVYALNEMPAFLITVQRSQHVIYNKERLKNMLRE